jgi:hypothetical protein
MKMNITTAVVKEWNSEESDGKVAVHSGKQRLCEGQRKEI